MITILKNSYTNLKNKTLYLKVIFKNIKKKMS